MTAPLAVALTVASGYALAWVVLRRSAAGASRAIEALAYAPALGFGGLSILFFFAVALGSAPVGVGVFVAASAVLALVLARVVGSRPAATPRPERWGRVEIALGLAAAVATIAVVADAIDESHRAPDGSWDAIAIWNRTARFLFRAGSHTRDLLAQLDAGHPDYPLYLPAALAGQFASVGSASADIPRLTGLVLLLATPLLLAVTVRRLACRWVGLAAAVVFLSAPLVPLQAANQMGDVPVAYLLLAAAGGLASQLHPDAARRVPPALAGACCGLVAWTKNEGIPLAAVLAGAFLVFALAGGADRRRQLRAGALAFAGALPALAALVLFKATWAPRSDFIVGVTSGFDRALDGGRWGTSLSALAEELRSWEWWGPVWPYLALAAIVGFAFARGMRRPHVRFLSLATFGFGFGLVVVYVMTPLPQLWHIATSLRRLLFQIFPTATLLALVAAGAATLRGCPGDSRPLQSPAPPLDPS